MPYTDFETPRFLIVAESNTALGMWVDLEDFDDVEDVLAAVAKTVPGWAEAVQYDAEEGVCRAGYVITEVEFMPKVKDVGDALSYKEELGDSDPEVFLALYEMMGTVDFSHVASAVRDDFVGTFDSLEDYAWETLDGEDLSPKLRQYFDVQAYIADITADLNIVEHSAGTVWLFNA